MMFIVHRAGCVVLEEFVLHLIRFFRLNGINALSELTEEEKVFKYGRGVFLNEMLSQADIVFVLCTDGTWIYVLQFIKRFYICFS